MNKQQFLIDAGLEVQTLEFWIEQQWLVPEQSAHDVSFSDTDVARAHLIRDLKGDSASTTRASTSSCIWSISCMACAVRSKNCTRISRHRRASP